MIWGTYPLQHVTLFRDSSIRLGRLVLTTQSLVAFGLALGVAGALIAFFRLTRIGLAMRGVAEGHQIMQSMGISVRRILNVSWGLAGIAATVGGILMGGTLGFQLGLSQIGLLAIPAAFIGGLFFLVLVVFGGIFRRHTWNRWGTGPYGPWSGGPQGPWGPQGPQGQPGQQSPQGQPPAAPGQPGSHTGPGDPTL